MLAREARATSDERDIFRTARAARGRAREMEASESREDEASMPLPAFADDANRALAREIEVRRGRSPRAGFGIHSFIVGTRAMRRRDEAGVPRARQADGCHARTRARGDEGDGWRARARARARARRWRAKNI